MSHRHHRRRACSGEWTEDATFTVPLADGRSAECAVQLSCSWEIDYHYGADADGNRGIEQTGYSIDDWTVTAVDVYAADCELEQEGVPINALADADAECIHAGLSHQIADHQPDGLEVEMDRGRGDDDAPDRERDYDR